MTFRIWQCPIENVILCPLSYSSVNRPNLNLWPAIVDPGQSTGGSARKLTPATRWAMLLTSGDSASVWRMPCRHTPSAMRRTTSDEKCRLGCAKSAFLTSCSTWCGNTCAEVNASDAYRGGDEPVPSLDRTFDDSFFIRLMGRLLRPRNHDDPSTPRLLVYPGTRDCTGTVLISAGLFFRNST